MGTLDDYLTGSFTSDARDVVEVEGLAREVAATLVRVFNHRAAWPYRLTRDGWTQPTSVSQSTTAMVLVALERFLGGLRAQPTRKSPSFPNIALSNTERSETLRVAGRGADLLRAAVVRRGSASTYSGTYGSNDPVTLSFLATLIQGPNTSGLPEWVPVREYVKRRTRQLSGRDAYEQQQFYDDDLGKDVVPNAIIPLRVIQSHRAAHRGRTPDYPRFRECFEARLHDHLSFSSIPDSRFDPAELTFCLEGLLLCREHSVDPSLFKRVIEVLAKAQQESAFWRPTTPFLASEQGMSLFPVSVEVANSLLRSCQLYDGGTLHDTFGSMGLSLFRRYWQWLRARTVRFRYQEFEHVGWQSEHVNEAEAIHVWETSQVLEFLLAYRRLLLAHMARTTLILSRFTYNEPKARTNWGSVTKQFEPVTTLGPEYRVYKRIGADFVRGWADGGPENYSMLLYGPPGTGKTTVADNLADVLSLRRITITVSDFLAGGGAEIEARAKAIFDVLSAQSECVVLFDEIDNFLLDRDSKRYIRQDSVFQFMTPGMLTKLNDLRRSSRLIFVIATNYENRIDPAIKRPGRIDQRYLVLPPDAAARKRILQGLLAGKRFASGRGPTASEWSKLEDASLFLGYKEIEGAVKAMGSRPLTVAGLSELLRSRARTTRLGIYADKFDANSQEAPPIEEFLCLLGMALPNRFPDFVDGRVVAAAAAALSRLGAANMRAVVRQHAPGLAPAAVRMIADRLAQSLPAVG